MLNSEIIKPVVFLLTSLTIVPDTLASPVTILLSPLVFFEASFLPVVLSCLRLLEMLAEFS